MDIHSNFFFWSDSSATSNGKVNQIRTCNHICTLSTKRETKAIMMSNCTKFFLSIPWGALNSENCAICLKIHPYVFHNCELKNDNIFFWKYVHRIQYLHK